MPYIAIPYMPDSTTVKSELPASAPALLFVSDRRAGWAGEVDHFEALEADFATPFLEIRGGIIKRVTEFDQHVQRHEQPENVFATRVIDQRFDGYERATWREGVVRGADELHLFSQDSNRAESFPS
jgi:hypothetical protein